jgi:hypothetical protein
MAPKSSSSTFIIIEKLSDYIGLENIDILKTALYVLLENIILFLVYYYSNIK